jgi:hypothetical protein
VVLVQWRLDVALQLASLTAGVDAIDLKWCWHSLLLHAMGGNIVF